jgi:hypothetical protein
MGQTCPDVDGLDVGELEKKVTIYMSVANWVLETLAPATWLRCIGVWAVISHDVG